MIYLLIKFVCFRPLTPEVLEGKGELSDAPMTTTDETLIMTRLASTQTVVPGVATMKTRRVTIATATTLSPTNPEEAQQTEG